ncbi:HD domain-containing phosphohydrolase [Vibrio rotiferianus]|uniref:HD domain-containing phosphohydrolase n=1 Tax=Vibrio rotiferianus TaxID=190895 RepID=UPI0028943749|nr:Response regulator [Vibrio rotiferianus]CAH1561566.1 Response regulator [Vibrio rotiferianus]
MKKRLTRWLAVILWLGTTAVSASNDESWDVKRILVLHSYDPSYQWTNDIQHGIEEGFAQATGEVKLSIEYLDSKRVHSHGYLQRMGNYLQLKYEGYQFDGVVVTDDAALQFIKTYYPNAERKTPIVAVGINNLKATLDNVSTNGSVLYEVDRIDENINLINKLRPKIKTLYYLADHSITSEHIRQLVLEHMKRFPQIKVVEIRSKTLSETAELLKHISPDDAVLLTHYNTETSKGKYHTYQEISHVIGTSSAAPVFVFWEHYLGEPGILGGYLNRSKNFGFEAAELMAGKVGLSLLPTIKEQPVTEAVLDHIAIEKYNISRYLIPKSAKIINKPAPLITINYKTLLVVGAIIGVLSLIVVVQFMVIRQRKEIDRKNRKIVVLQKRTLSVQKEMIHVLGEAIESRSGETGNHVKRVAKLSAKLAELCGLSHREIEMIEIISPMHDVGKIAVPESILDKCGPLTPDEWEVMKLHTTKGFNLLNTKEGDVTKLAAIVAHEHHERWDGNGYPNGLEGESIHLFARITAIVDVFDALLSERCYKRAWSIQEVIELFEKERGQQFDPFLCQLLLDNLDDFVEVRNMHPDFENIASVCSDRDLTN